MDLPLKTYKNQAFILKNFVVDEIDALNKWCLENYTKSFFKDGNMGKPGTRLTTRNAFKKDGLVSFPKEAYIIKQKIINALNITEYKEPGFHHGIVCGIGFDDGDIYSHRDPTWHSNTYTFHCNLLSNKSIEGGNTYINNKIFSVDVGDLLCYDVSNQQHRVDTIIGDSPRILWVFGFSLPNSVI